MMRNCCTMTARKWRIPVIMGIWIQGNAIAAAPLPPETLPRLPSPAVAVQSSSPMQFPNAYGSHPRFPLEWWYITGWLKDSGGHSLGFQLTFFRLRMPKIWANPSAFNPRQIYFAQAALGDPRIGHLLTAQRAARGGLGLAGANRDTSRVWIDHWQLRQKGQGYTVSVNARRLAYRLHISVIQPPLPEGPDGISQKGPNPRNASYYYSLPHLLVNGKIRIRNHPWQQVSGQAWLDHEWSSSYLPAGAVGWDWTGLNLQNGGALMLFRMRRANGSLVWQAGTWRHANGKVQYLPGSAITMQPLRSWQSPESGNRYPTAWKIRAGSLDFTLHPLMENQEFRAIQSTGSIYWEGAVAAMKSGHRIGSGYLELTGYGARLHMGIGGTIASRPTRQYQPGFRNKQNIIPQPGVTEKAAP